MNKWGELLGELSASQRDSLFSLAQERALPRGATLVREGEPVREIAFIVEGLLRVSTEALAEGTLATIGHGEIVGEIAFLDESTASATVTVEEPTQILALPYGPLRDLLDEDAALAATLYRFLARLGASRLRNTLGHVNARMRRLAPAQATQLQGLQAELAAFKDLVLAYDKAARKPDPPERDRLAAALHAHFRQLTGALHAALGPASPLAEVAQRVFGATIQREVLPYLQMTEVARRMYTKPRGYAGDFYTIELIYQNEGGGTDAAGALIDQCFLQEPAAQAVRNRRGLLAREIAATLAATPDRPAQVTSLASGPARELFDVLEQHPTSRLRATCVDMDPKAIAFVADKAAAAGLSDAFHLVNQNLIYLSLGRAQLDLPPQDLVYSIGLIDYFSDTLVIRLLDFAHRILRPGGRVILGNFHPANPTKALMDHVLEWTLLHRTEADMDRLFAASAFGRPATRVLFEEQGINLFAECVKA